MDFKFLSFLTEKGWDGILDMFRFLVIWTAVGMTCLYWLLIRRKTERPKNIKMAGHVIKIILLGFILYVLIIY